MFRLEEASIAAETSLQSEVAAERIYSKWKNNLHEACWIQMGQ